MAIEAVRVDVGAFTRDEDGSFEGTAIRFVPDDGRDGLPALRVARDRALAAFPDVLGFWGPVPLPGSAAVLSIQWWDLLDDLVGPLAVLADALAAQGFAGVLDTFTDRAPAFERRVGETLHGMAVVLSPRLRPDALERALARGDRPVQLEDVEPQVLDACLERGLAWCRVDSGRHYAQYATASYEVAESEREGLLRRSLSGDDVAAFTCERWPEERRSMRFAHPARLVLELGQRTPVADPGPFLALAEEVLRSFADLADYGCVLPTTGPTHDLSGVLRRTRSLPPVGVGNLYWTRHLESHRVPDVFVGQLLGPGHEVGWLPVENWAVTDVGDARVVTARAPRPWVTGVGPDEDVLAMARGEFAPLLISADDDARQRALFVHRG